MNQDKLEQIYKKVKQGGVSIDTRNIRPGQVFFNITTAEKYNKEAVSLGASAVIWNQEWSSQRGFMSFKVKDVVDTLQEVARHHRESLSCRIVVICGSNGKTSLKNWLYHQIRLKQHIYCKKNNYNNEVGVPLCLLEIKQYHYLALVEVGIRHVGEHKKLLEVIAPSEVITTNYGCDHLGPLGVNHRSAYNEIEQYCKPRNIKNSIALEYQGEEQSIHAYMRRCSQRVIKNLALSKEVNQKQVDRVLSRELEPLRGSWVYRKQQTVYLDCYNANPSSYKFSLLNHPYKHKFWVYIIGHMADLGSYSREYHQEIYEWIKANLNKEDVYFIGSNWKSIVSNRVWQFKELYQKVKQWKYKYIYIKGSRELYLEDLVSTK